MKSVLLESELSAFNKLRLVLKKAQPELDEETLADTLEGATNLHEAVTVVVRSALEDEAMARGLRGRMDELELRLRRIDERAEKKREIASSAMAEAGLSKIVAPDVTLSLRPSPAAVVITDESLLPEWFFIPQPPKLDRRKVLEVLKAGDAVMGAELANPRLCLSVRTK